MLVKLLRTLGVALGVAVVTGLVMPGAALAKEDIMHRFAASSGDACLYGFTSGHMTWSATLPVVGVQGSIIDNPVSSTSACCDDGRISVAQFVAYTVNGVAVDRHAERADNSEQSFAFRLAANTSTARIAVVTVQVCRFSSNPAPDYCGDTKRYPNPF